MAVLFTEFKDAVNVTVTFPPVVGVNENCASLTLDCKGNVIGKPFTGTDVVILIGLLFDGVKPFNLNVPVVNLPAFVGDGLNVNDVIVGGLIVIFTAFVIPPFVAVTVPTTLVLTGFVVIK